MMKDLERNAKEGSREEAEKMLSEDKALMFSAFDGAWDVHNVAQNRENLLQMGHGIGLAIVQDILKAYRGQLRVTRSATLGGACFVF